jgi:hypothetical protein
MNVTTDSASRRSRYLRITLLPGVACKESFQAVSGLKGLLAGVRRR